MAKAKENESQYRLLTAELLQLIHELRMRKESLIPQYLLRIASAEAAFYRAGAEFAEYVDKHVREVGQVQPVVFPGVPGYTNVITLNPQTDSPPQTNNPPPSIQRPPSNLRVRGIYQFDAQLPTELPFRVGDIMNVVETHGEWYQAELNGRVGLIPSNYVEVLR